MIHELDSKAGFLPAWNLKPVDTTRSAAAEKSAAAAAPARPGAATGNATVGGRWRDWQLRELRESGESP